MRRLYQLKNKDKKIKRLLAGPYVIWAAGFIIIPLLMIFYYGLTDKEGHFTFINLAKITTSENLKALGLALLLSLISDLPYTGLSPLHGSVEFKGKQIQFYRTDIHPSYVDEFPAAHPCVAEPFREKRYH